MTDLRTITAHLFRTRGNAILMLSVLCGAVLSIVGAFGAVVLTIIGRNAWSLVALSLGGLAVVFLVALPHAMIDLAQRATVEPEPRAPLRPYIAGKGRPDAEGEEMRAGFFQESKNVRKPEPPRGPYTMPEANADDVRSAI